jgi:hypothetical protein
MIAWLLVPIGVLCWVLGYAKGHKDGWELSFDVNAAEFIRNRRRQI